MGGGEVLVSFQQDCAAFLNHLPGGVCQGREHGLWPWPTERVDTLASLPRVNLPKPVCILWHTSKEFNHIVHLERHVAVLLSALSSEKYFYNQKNQFVKKEMLLTRNKLHGDASMAVSHLVYPVWFYQLPLPVLLGASNHALSIAQYFGITEYVNCGNSTHPLKRLLTTWEKLHKAFKIDKRTPAPVLSNLYKTSVFVEIWAWLSLCGGIMSV